VDAAKLDCMDVQAEPALHVPREADASTQKLFRSFVRDGRIVALPAKYTKRRMLLDHVAQLFEPGIRYPEHRVNLILRRIYDDYAELRRALVDEGFLTREYGVYWRIGGTVIV